jgi:hypothetical protein
VQPGAVEILPVQAELDVLTSTVSWRLETPLRTEEADIVFAVTALSGCDALDSCQPPVRGVSASDVAPNDFADPLLAVSPEIWWSDLV